LHYLLDKEKTMTKTANLSLRIDPEIKKDADELYRSFGITLSEAITIFLKKSLMVHGLPFEVKQPRYNAETEAAMQEARDIMAGKIKTKVYHSVEELNADLDAEYEEEYGESAQP
jgi:DNA-damage-inducible protein J